MTTGTSVFQRRTHVYDRMQPACRMHTIVCSLHTIVRPLHTIVICSQHTIVCRLQAACVPSVAPALVDGPSFLASLASDNGSDVYSVSSDSTRDSAEVTFIFLC